MSDCVINRGEQVRVKIVALLQFESYILQINDPNSPCSCYFPTLSLPRFEYILYHFLKKDLGGGCIFRIGNPHVIPSKSCDAQVYLDYFV